MKQKEEIFITQDQERQQKFFYWLYGVEGIGNRTIRELLQQEKTPENIYYCTKEKIQEWIQMKIISGRQGLSLSTSKAHWNVYSEYEKLQSAGIEMYPYYHPLYPQKLLEIPDSPAALFAKGKLPEEDKISIAIIGARSCSEYGCRMAKEYGETLGAAGIQIISGLARGVDGISQKAAIDAGGTSFGVLGCGVDICYPAQNKGLYEQLIHEGGILSTYMPGVQPKAQFFPPRNRIISGLADGILVIEARQKSGTQITVDMALEQGRDVFALPGRVGDPLSEGCNRMILQGAFMTLSPYELVETLGVELGRAKKCEGGSLKNTEYSLEEAKLVEILDVYPKTLDMIFCQARKTLKCDISLQEVMQLLFQLCLKGKAEQVGGGMNYIKK